MSPDGDLLAICTIRGFVRIYDIPNRRMLREFRGFLNSATTIEFFPEGHRLAAGSGFDGLLKTWDTESERELVTLPGGSTWAQRVQFSADGSAIGAWASSGGFHFFRAPSLAEIEVAESHAPQKSISR